MYWKGLERLMDQPVAVLDLGTNSTRFLLADPVEGFSPRRVLDRESKVTRLGEGVDEQGKLTAGAIGRVLDLLSEYDERVRERGGRWSRGVATSACRRADNGDAFLDQVEQTIGIRPDIITGDREADVIFRGVHASLPRHESGRIIDIGGGSTEWIVFERGESRHRESRPIGVVTLRERATVRERWDKEATGAARLAVREQLPDDPGEGPLIVVGGTGTTLSAHRRNLEEYDPDVVHGDRIPLAEVHAIREEFESLSFEEMGQLPMVQPGREDVMIPGIVILETVAEFAGVDEVVVSDYGILAGLIEEATHVESTP